MAIVSWHGGRPDPAHPERYAAGFYSDNLPTARLSFVMRHRVWSPIAWRDGRRKKEAFRAADCLALDFDDGRLSLADAYAWVKRFRLAHIIGTTKSHGLVKGKNPPCDRFRVLLFFVHTITDLWTYEYNAKKALAKLPADPACGDGARFFYPCAEIIYEDVAGAPIRVYDAPPPPPPEEEIARIEAYRAAGVLPAWASVVLTHGVPEGRRHAAVYRLGAELGRLGYDDNEILKLILASPLADIGVFDAGRTATDGARRGREEFAGFIASREKEGEKGERGGA